MGIAVHLLFDEAFTAQVTEIWQAIEGAGIAEYGDTSQNHPHVTLAVYEALDTAPAAAALAGLLAEERPPQLNFANLGQFLQPQPVLFIAPTVTQSLLALQRRAHEVLAPFGRQAWPHYLPDRWVPHCTLAMDMAPAQLAPALEFARALPLPLTGQVAGVEIITFRPVINVLTLPWPRAAAGSGGAA